MEFTQNLIMSKAKRKSIRVRLRESIHFHEVCKGSNILWGLLLWWISYQTDSQAHSHTHNTYVYGWDSLLFAVSPLETFLFPFLSVLSVPPCLQPPREMMTTAGEYQAKEATTGGRNREGERWIGNEKRGSVRGKEEEGEHLVISSLLSSSPPLHMWDEKNTRGA